MSFADTSVAPSPAADDTTAVTATPAPAPAPAPAQLVARGHNSFDRTGAMSGRGDEQGNFFDASGAMSGRVDSSGN